MNDTHMRQVPLMFIRHTVSPGIPHFIVLYYASHRLLSFLPAFPPPPLPSFSPLKLKVCGNPAWN